MLDAYEVIKEENIEDVHARGTLLRHKKSGARIALLANDDENKVFNIAFRTPPANSTGVAHIIEHSVLCGSRKFPLKDPFVELVKGSMNTFLNAMTYPDKTMYPVASCNDQDFQNLMDVYLDAVFYPNIYLDDKRFRQEGWHYQLEHADDPITYNGVVYNEMKGAFSSADDVLERTVFNSLFPDTPYGVESGGDPEVIPELSYEEFLNFHRKYYHPSNSYIYLYGNMDMEEKLNWLDQEYLSKFDRIEVDSEITLQKPFAQPVTIEESYPILDDESEKQNTYLAVSKVLGDCSDVTLNIAFSVLEYVLLDAPGAPVKQALLDAGIGKDIDGSHDDGILQPFFSIVARNADPEDKDRFLQVIRETLEQIANDGLDPKALASGINYFEFRFREADFASYPRGLIYGIDLFDTWLYDENNPFAYLKEIKAFEDLKANIGTGYFENLIRTYLIDNPHASLVILKPEKGLAAKREAATAEKLAAFKNTLSQEEIENIVRETAELKAYQEAEDTEEDIATIPLLKIEDIARKTSIQIQNEKIVVNDTTYLRHNYQTHGISYLTLLFDTEKVPDAYVPYLGILKGVLGVVSTEHYTYGQLFHEINANTGGIHFGLQVLPVGKGEDGEKGRKMFGVQAKYLYAQQDFVFRMIEEMITTSVLDDEKRLKEIISSSKAGLEHSIPSAGHASAARRALSYNSELSAWSEATGGIDLLHLVEKIDADFDGEKENLIEKLSKLMHMIFRPENLVVSLTAAEEGFSGVEENIIHLKEVLYTDAVETGCFAWEPVRKKEGFKTSGQVQYVASAGNFRKAGYDYSGTFRMLRLILNYDYLWMNLRVLGGAYGCMSAFKRSGDSYLVSYRDPHLKNTLKVYQELPGYLESFEADERTMTKYIIGTISELDTPMNPSAKGSMSLNCFFSGLTEADFQKEREEILDATAEDIRRLAGAAQAIVDAQNICVIGSESVLAKDGDVLDSVEALNL